MDQLQIYSKPELVLISEKKKLRDYNPEERTTKSANLVYRLLNLLGVNDGKTEHHTELVSHVTDFYGHFTFEQIEKAFGMFISRQLKTQPFQQLNAVVFGNVMQEFDDYQKEQTKIYKIKTMEQKETKPSMPEEDIEKFMSEKIKEAIEVYKNTGDIELASSKYDYLDKKGLLQGNLSKEDFDALKRLKYETVKIKLIDVYGKQRCISVDEKTENKNIIKELQEKVSGNVVYHCKFEMLKDYFDKQLK